MNDSDPRRRVVITGTGAITPIGKTVDAFWSGVTGGVCGTRPARFSGNNHEFVRPVARIADFDPVASLRHWKRDKTIHFSDRYSWLAAVAAGEAVAGSGFPFPSENGHRVAAIVGSAAGGQTSGEQGCRDRFIQRKPAVHPMFLPRVIGSSAAAHIGMEFGAKGPTFGIMSGAVSAAHCISYGRDLIRYGLCDVVIAGGAESAVTYGTQLAAQAMGLTSAHGCFPFSKFRDGTVLAEGAGILVLEDEAHARRRGAVIEAELLGIGLTSSGENMLTLDSEPAFQAMRLALADAGCQPSEIDYLNLDGSGCPANDVNETRAVKKLFGEHCGRLSTSSTKAMHGHALGAAPAIEAIVCINAIKSNWIPATIGLHEPDPDCDLDYQPLTGRAKPVSIAMSNSFSVGGAYASLIFGAVRP